eukprot:6559163-Alexandrium_andersonii.AAC.1
MLLEMPARRADETSSNQLSRETNSSERRAFILKLCSFGYSTSLDVELLVLLATLAGIILHALFYGV